MAEIYIDGAKELITALDKLPQSIQRQAIINAGKKALRPARMEAKRVLKAEAQSFANERGFSKLRFVANNLKILASKNRKIIGVDMYVKGPDMPVGNRFWKLYRYVLLLVQGSKDVRFTRSTKANRGRFQGFGNFVETGYKNTKAQVDSTFKNEVGTELDKAVKRTVRRYGKRY